MLGVAQHPRQVDTEATVVFRPLAMEFGERKMWVAVGRGDEFYHACVVTFSLVGTFTRSACIPTVSPPFVDAGVFLAVLKASVRSTRQTSAAASVTVLSDFPSACSLRNTYTVSDATATGPEPIPISEPKNILSESVWPRNSFGAI